MTLSLIQKFFSVCLFFLLLISSVWATDYYVDADGGDDAVSGRTPTEAWCSLAKVNSWTLEPGDRVLFRRGCVWRGFLVCQAGNREHRIVYGAYGDGNKPMLLGSVPLNKEEYWQAVPGHDHVWSVSSDGHDLQWSRDVGNIILRKAADSERYAAFRRWSLDDLTQEADYYYDRESRQIFIYSLENPARLWTEMEAAIREHIVSCRASVVVEDLAISCGAAHGVSAVQSEDCTIRRCDFSWVGGGLLDDSGNDQTRFGNGVEFWTSARDALVEDCFFEQIYDVAMTNQGRGPCLVQNVIWRRNRTSRCEQGYEIWFSDPETEVQGILFENNECQDNGFGWSHKQRPDLNGTALLSYQLEPRVLNVTIRDNVFGNSATTLIWYFNDRLNEIHLDNNVWRCPGRNGKPGIETPLFLWDQKSGAAPVDFEEYRTRTGQDEHSRFEE